MLRDDKDGYPVVEGLLHVAILPAEMLLFDMGYETVDEGDSAEPPFAGIPVLVPNAADVVISDVF